MELGRGCTLEMLPHGVTIKDTVQQKANQADQQGNDESVFIADLGDIINKWRTWKRYLPTVKPFYAVKANDEYPVLKVLADIGVNFDCASKVEIETVLSMGVSPDRIVYAHACKHASMLKYAADKHVTMTTFDSEQEMYKIKKVHPNAKTIIRIRPSSAFKVKQILGRKFGCGQHEVRPLLKLALSLGLQVVGVSFHVGYLCEEAEAYRDAIRRARDVFNIASDLGIDMELLDIGGGFPGKKLNEGVTFEELALVIDDSLKQYFGKQKDIRVIAEPGEFFVASSFTLAAQIIGRRTDSRHDGMSKTSDHFSNVSGATSNKKPINQTRFMYYLNDGRFGSFSGVTGCSDIYPHTLKQKTEAEEEYDSIVWGPTCDDLDEIFSSVKLCKLEVGDWLYFPNMGAYTVPLQSRFNGMPMPKIYYVCDSEIWHSTFPNCSSTE